MGLGVPVLHGPNQRFEKVGLGPNGRPQYRARFQKGISYRPDPINHPHQFSPSNPHLKDVGGGGLRSDEGDCIVGLPPRANGAFTFAFRHLNEEAITMRFQGASNALIEKLSDKVAIYRDVFTNVDLQVTVKSIGWKVDWIYKGPGHPTDITVQYTAPYDREVMVLSPYKGQINVHDPAAHTDYSFFKLSSPFYLDDDGERWMTLSHGAGNRIVYTMPDMSDVAYPFVFDPSASFIPDASVEVETVDGWTTRESVDQTFANIRAGAATSSNDNGGTVHAALRGSTTTDQFQTLRRSSMYFDTRILSGSWLSGIAAADVSLWAYGNNLITTLGDFDVDLVARSDPPSSFTAIGTADHPISDFDTSTVYSSINTTSLTVSAWNEFVFGTLPDFETGQPFQLGMLMSWDTDNSFGGTWSSSGWSRWYHDSADGTNPHYLEVLFEVGETSGQWLEGASDETAAATWTTDSWTPNANEKAYLLFYYAGTDASDGTPTVSGNGLTWTNKHYTESGTGHVTCVFEGSAEASPSTGAITVTLPGSDTAKNSHWIIIQSSRYQGYVQSATGSASTSTVNGPTTTLGSARSERSIVACLDCWFHSGETGGPYPRGAGGITRGYYVDGAETDVGTQSTMISGLYFPDPESDDDWTTTAHNRTAPGETVRKVLLLLELVPTDENVAWLDSHAGDQAAASTYTTGSFTPTASYDTYLWFYARTTTASDGDPTVSGNGHTWSKVYGVLIGTQHHFYLYKGTGGTSTGVATITGAGTDLFDRCRYCALELPDSWTVTQSVSTSGTDTTTGDWILSATFSSSTAATNRMVLAFGGLNLVDQEVYPVSPLDFWDLVHKSAQGTHFVLMDSDGGAYTVNKVYSDGTGGDLKYAMHVMEFSMTVTLAKVVSEVLNMVEGAVKIPGSIKIVSEALNMVESAIKFFGFNKVVSEALNMVEGTVKVLGLRKVVTEVLSMVEGTKIWRHFRRVVSESLNMVEGTVKSTFPVLTRIFYETLSATRTLTETGLSATRRFYEVIKTTRTLK